MVDSTLSTTAEQAAAAAKHTRLGVCQAPILPFSTATTGRTLSTASRHSALHHPLARWLQAAARKPALVLHRLESFPNIDVPRAPREQTMPPPRPLTPPPGSSAYLSAALMGDALGARLAARDHAPPRSCRAAAAAAASPLLPVSSPADSAASSLTVR